MGRISLVFGSLVWLFIAFVAPALQAQDWRSEAEARIEAHRKADFIIKIRDMNGDPIEGATVGIEMQRHAFKFGTAVDAAWTRDEPRADLSSGDLDLGEKLSAFRVQLDAAQGAVIQSAFLQFTADKDNQDQATELTIWAAAEGDAPDFDVSAISSRTRTGSSVSWNVEPWLVQEERAMAQRTPDIAALVQEIVDRDDWVPGQHIVFILDGFGKRSARTFDESPEAASRLVVMIDGEENITQVLSSVDDAEEAGPDFYGDDAHRYREELIKLFNYAAPGNALKWRPWELDSKIADGALSWLSSHDIPVRGHAMIWSSWRWNAIPVDVEERQQEPDFVRQRAAEHVALIASTYAGQVPEWDVINEPLHEKDLENIIGFDERLNWFQLADMADPDARMFVNDFDILEGPAQVDDYKLLITDLIAAGAAVEGVGLQGHFLGQAPTPEQLVARLASLAELGLPLQITEFDMNNNWSEHQQAIFMEQVLVAAFAEPAMTAFNMWGFWDGNHWLGNAPLYASDWRLKSSGAVWKDFVFNKWWTEAEGMTDAEGELTLRGFKGDYLLTVSHNGYTDTLHTNLPFQHTIDWTLEGVSVANEVEIEHPHTLSAELYPNPASQTSYLDLEVSDASVVKVVVFDVQGRTVWEKPSISLTSGKHVLEIETDHVTAGRYFVRVTSVSGKVKTIKNIPLSVVK